MGCCHVQFAKIKYEAHLQNDRKMSWFDCHSCFLPQNHSFRPNRNAFIKGRTVHRWPPQLLPLEMEWQRVHDLLKVTKKYTIEIDGFAKNIHNWIKRSIFRSFHIGNTNFSETT